MNIRFLFLFIILGIFVLVILFSAIQIAYFYAKPRKEDEPFDSVEADSKEQIISDLTAENERLNAELKTLRDDEFKLVEDEE